jgi:hypothetical protein
LRRKDHQQTVAIRVSGRDFERASVSFGIGIA